jgi:hypothetical protein
VRSARARDAARPLGVGRLSADGARVLYDAFTLRGAVFSVGDAGYVNDSLGAPAAALGYHFVPDPGSTRAEAARTRA